MPKKKTAKSPRKSPRTRRRREKCHPENHSGNPRLNAYIGFQFDWCEPWDWEDCTVDPDLCDADGNPPNELCGSWQVDSVHEDGETAWVRFVPTDGDHLMEFPLSLIADPEAQ